MAFGGGAPFKCSLSWWGHSGQTWSEQRSRCANRRSYTALIIVEHHGYWMVMVSLWWLWAWPSLVLYLSWWGRSLGRTLLCSQNHNCGSYSWYHVGSAVVGAHLVTPGAPGAPGVRRKSVGARQCGWWHWGGLGLLFPLDAGSWQVLQGAPWEWSPIDTALVHAQWRWCKVEPEDAGGANRIWQWGQSGKISSSWICQFSSCIYWLPLWNIFRSTVHI